MPVSKAFNSVESRMPFKLCAPNAPKIMPKQIKIAPVTTYVLFIAQRCEKPMKLVSLMWYFMKFKFFFFVTLFILFSCSEKNTEKKQSQTKIDYYQFYSHCSVHRTLSGFRDLWWGANDRGIHFAAGPDWMHLMLEGLGKHILIYITAILKATGLLF